MTENQGRTPHQYGVNPADRPIWGQQPGPAPQPGSPSWTPPPNWWAHGQMAAPPVPRPRRPRRFTVGIAMAAVGVTIAAGLSAVAISQSGGSNPQQASTFSPFNAQNGFNSGGRSGQSVPSIDGSGGSTSTSSGQATAAQQVGVVDINTVIDYGSERAAGTGMVLTSNGEILTNNHVIDGATTIQVTVVSTGKTYTASVVGDDPSDDVAVLQLSRASGLATANLGDSSKVAVGDAVTAVGNAGGTGGTPSSATGTVTAVNQSITASDQGGSDSENLTGVIQINANIEAGDSGGPLYASNGTVVGIDTAASTSDSTGTTQGFAIPIAKATSIASQITSGNWSSTIHRGATAFLGVQIASGNSGGSVDQGATIAGVVDNSAAANAGLQEGDTITGIDGTTISSPSDLSSTMANYQPGQHVTVTWTDGSGQSQSASVTLGSGPAD